MGLATETGKNNLEIGNGKQFLYSARRGLVRREYCVFEDHYAELFESGLLSVIAGHSKLSG